MNVLKKEFSYSANVVFQYVRYKKEEKGNFHLFENHVLLHEETEKEHLESSIRCSYFLFSFKVNRILILGCFAYMLLRIYAMYLICYSLNFLVIQ